MSITGEVKQKLEHAFPGAIITIADHSHDHAGHQQEGGAHLSAQIIYSGFKGKTMVEQHQMIYKILAEELKQKIHALALNTKVSQNG